MLKSDLNAEQTFVKKEFKRSTNAFACDKKNAVSQAFTFK